MGLFLQVTSIGRRRLPAVPSSRRLFAATDRDTVGIDTSGLFPAHTHQPGKGAKFAKTELVKELEMLIKMRGPIPVAEYMKQALQHPRHGYYMQERPQIGRQGDFVTAPEISQVFGELIGVWCVAVWESMGRPAQFELVEMGPGKGTLMQDLLRATSAFPAFRAAAAVRMVETSEALRHAQRRALGVKGAAATDAEGNCSMRMRDGGAVYWHAALSQVPRGQPVLVVAQELLDALPVHQFVFTDRGGWRERLVDVDDGDGPLPFRFIVAPNATPAVKALLQPPDERSTTAGLAAAAFAGPAAVVGADAGPAGAQPPLGVPSVAADRPSVGDSIEVCPLAWAVVQDVARRVAEDGGGALFVDYGENHAQQDTLRAFKGHAEVPLLAEPGLADITADVDFGTLRRVAGQKPGTVVAGPVPQGKWLLAMGIQARLDVLVGQEHVSEQQAESIFQSMLRLVDPSQMGSMYKVMAVTDSRQSGMPPGFAERGAA